MRLALALALVLAGPACTIGAPPPAVPRAPAPDPDRMPSSVLDHQDPGADTSHNPVRYVDGGPPNSVLDSIFGFVHRLPLFWCDASHHGDGDAGGLVVIGAAALAMRRRARKHC